MSDAIASQPPLDPARPWITDDDQLPARMSWLDTFFNPAGKSTTLHFTRAWTVLFMVQVIVWFGIGILLTGILGAAGADTTGFSVFVGYAIAFTFVVTTILSYIIHVRRLNHAGRSSVWAALVLIPLIASLAMFAGALQQNSTAYQERYDARTEFLEDPSAWRQKQLDDQREAQAKAAEERANRTEEDVPEMCKASGEAGGNRGQGGNRGPQQNRGPNVEQSLPAKEAAILRPAVSGIVQPIMFLSLPVMIWTLLWVARAPLQGAQYPKRGMISILVSPAGRISRLQYWAGIAGIVVIGAAIFIVQAIVGSIAPPIAPLIFFAATPLLWFGFSITAKRLHDVGKPALYMLWPWVVTIGMAALTGLVIFLNMQAFQFAQTCGGEMPIAVTFMFIVSGIAVISGHLGLLFLLGTSAPEMQENKYGLAPIPGKTGPQYPEGYTPRGYDGDALAN